MLKPKLGRTLLKEVIKAFQREKFSCDCAVRFEEQTNGWKLTMRGIEPSIKRFRKTYRSGVRKYRDLHNV